MSAIKPEKVTNPDESNSSVNVWAARTGTRWTRSAKRSAHAGQKKRSKFAWLINAEPRQPLFVPANQALTTAPENDALVGVIKRKRVSRKIGSNGRYLTQTCRPIVSFFFLMPLILFYEVAKILIGPKVACSGIDYWVCETLTFFGAGQLLVLPTLVTGILLAWHWRQRDHYGFSANVLAWMVIESIGLGVLLFWTANVVLFFFNGSDAGQIADPYLWTIGSYQWWSNVVVYTGTGIHEELIFRVMIMLPLMLVLCRFSGRRLQSAIIAAVTSSLLFSVAHLNWFNPAGEPFVLLPFVLRYVAACLFAGLFHYRGFGIAVGTHIIYNVLTLLAV